MTQWIWYMSQKEELQFCRIGHNHWILRDFIKLDVSQYAYSTVTTVRRSVCFQDQTTCPDIYICLKFTYHLVTGNQTLNITYLDDFSTNNTVIFAIIRDDQAGIHDFNLHLLRRLSSQAVAPQGRSHQPRAAAASLSHGACRRCPEGIRWVWLIVENGKNKEDAQICSVYSCCTFLYCMLFGDLLCFLAFIEWYA